MYISKRGSKCNTHPMLNMEIAGNFSEHFSDSSSNHEDLSKIQTNIKAANSPCKEEPSTNCTKTESSCKKGEIDSIENSEDSSFALATPTSKKTLPKQSADLSKTKTNIRSTSSSMIRDEKDTKNEGALSPQNISRFGITVDNEDRNVCNKTVNLSPLSSDKNDTISRTGCSDIEERPTTIFPTPGNVASYSETGRGGVLGNSVSPKCKTESNLVPNISNISRNLNSFNGNFAKYNSSTSRGDNRLSLNSSEGNSGIDYLQQHNHVFVFSTHLANKSAEAVLCGQFPTIIAYHCMQPTTKLFLEDFLKNPSKTAKLRRQYSLNIMNAMQPASSGVGSGQPSYWRNECNNSDRLPPQRLPLSHVGGSIVGKNTSWNPALAHENKMAIGPSTLDTINNVESEGKSDDKTNIPSLQGVKVPDENLTPQQRLHREEQLAKLKKMNKFLFPENEGNNIQCPPPHSSSSSTSINAESSGDILHNPDDMANNICSSEFANISDNLTKSIPQNLETINGIGASDSILPSDIIGSSNGVPNFKFGAPKSGQCDTVKEQTVVCTENSPDKTSGGNFVMNNCPSSEAHSVGSGPSDMDMSQSEWKQIQSCTLQDCLKPERKTALSTEPLRCEQNSSLSRSLSKGIKIYDSVQSRPNTGHSSTNRNNNGPPPPYHTTPRSASVPISAESPTHANKISPDLSLHSPQTPSHIQFGVSHTPPKMEITNPTISTCTNYIGSTNGGLSSAAQLKSHNNSILNNVITNSPESLHPRELDCIETGGQNTKLASPHKFKSASGLINDLTDMDKKYSNFKMGYPSCNIPPQNMCHNMQQMHPQFCRRIDNIPLNPNCSRVGQSKNAANFDPISSLTQMSQQLTGVGLSAIGGGGNASVGLGVMDINQGELIAGGLAVRRTGDSTLDYSNQLSNTNIDMVGGMAGALSRVTGQFGPEINNMLCGDTGHMDQRMLNGKMCVPYISGSFCSNSVLTGVGLRESAMECNDMSSLNRAINRRTMPSNFENLSMQPNVHVKVSTPNTIQYMPRRSQNMNNMRVPPSIEFFQRYSNSQVMGNMGGGVGHLSGRSMTNDIANSNGMNMSGSCTPMSTIVGQLSGSGNRAFDQNCLLEANVLSDNEYMNVPQ